VTAPLRIGVLGAGTIAERGHLPGLLAQPDVIVEAICDLDLQRAQAVAERHGVARAFADADALLALELDAVTCCTPNVTHAPLAISALESGKHVLLEKPPAVDAAALREMADAAETADRLLMPLFNHRFREEIVLARELVARGSLGRPYYARTTLLDRRGSTPGWITDRRTAGGGALIDLGIHHLDSMLHVLGYPAAQSVSGATYSRIGSYSVRYRADEKWTVADERGRDLEPGWAGDVEEAAFALVRFEDGLTLTLETAWTMNIPGARAWESAVYGDDAGLRIDPPPVVVAAQDGDRLVDTSYDVQPVPVYPDTHARAIRHFVDCIRGEDVPLSTPAQAIQLMEIIDGIYSSAETGREVTLDARAVAR
jgi:predicted dehydrogenase